MSQEQEQQEEQKTRRKRKNYEEEDTGRVREEVDDEDEDEEEYEDEGDRPLKRHRLSSSGDPHHSKPFAPQLSPSSPLQKKKQDKEADKVSAC